MIAQAASEDGGVLVPGFRQMVEDRRPQFAVRDPVPPPEVVSGQQPPRDPARRLPRRNPVKRTDQGSRRDLIGFGHHPPCRTPGLSNDRCGLRFETRI